jgi:hypothetical protein
MAYYNSQSETPDSYYDPQSNAVPQQDTGATIRKGIGTLVAVIGLNVAGVALTHKFIGAAKNTLKGWQANSKSVVRKAVADDVISQYSKIKQNLVKPYRDSLEKSPIYHALKQRDTYLNKLKDSGSSSYNFSRISSAFKDPLTFAGVTARIWKKNVLQGVAVAYGVDSLLGVTREMGLEKKEWYDVPGQASNFAKWGLISSVGGLLMGGTAPVAKAAGSLGMTAIGSVFKGELGQSFLRHTADKFGRVSLNKDLMYSQSILAKNDDLDFKSINYSSRPIFSNHEMKFLSTAGEKRLHFGKNLSEAWKGLGEGFNTAFSSITNKYPGTTFNSRIKRAFDVTKAAIQSSQEVLTKKSSLPPSSTTYGGLSVLKEIDVFSKEAAQWAKTRALPEKISLGNKDELNAFFNHTFKRQKKESTLQKLFGKVLKPVKLREVWNTDFVKETTDQLSAKYVASDAAQLMEHIGNLNVGTNIYRNPGIRGGMVDLNFLDPISMMRKAIAPILEHNINIPVIGTRFNLAELTGVQKYISDSPELYATRKKPNFYFVDNQKGLYNVADLVGQSDNNLFIYSKGGRWAAFNNGVAAYANTGRNLHRTTKNGWDKSQELRDIQVNKIKAALVGRTTAETNEILDRVDRGTYPENKFLGFLQSKGIDFPDALKNLSRTMHSKFGGKTNRLDISNFFDGRPEEAIAREAILENVYGGTNAMLSRVSNNKRAASAMADYVKSTQLGGRYKNFYAAITDQQVLANEVISMEAERSLSRDAVASLQNIKAYPREARVHNTVRPLGFGSEMTDYDVLRVNYIQNVFHDISKNSPNKTQPHPMLTLAHDLNRRGIITENERDGLLLNAKLHTFTVEDQLFKGAEKKNSEILKVLGKIQHRSKENNWATLNELTNFAANNRVPRPSIKYEQDRILQSIGVDPISSNTPFVSLPIGPLDALKEFANRAIERGTSAIGEYSPIKKYYVQHHGFMGNVRYMSKVFGLAAGVTATYKLADFAFAANPMFDDTMFESGITGAFADAIATTRMGIARVSDLAGITSVMKHIHGLAPKSETTLPGALVGGALGIFAKANPLSTATMALGGALANRILAPYLPDLTKSHEELVEIYSGRKQVPMMKSPTWLLGGTPWEGTNVIGYTPNWYVQAKSRWKETDTMYGSAFRKLIHEPLPFLGFNVGDIVDPYFMERKQYFSRPYGLTAGVFNEVPIIGSILSNTIGRIIKPQKTMHQEFLKRGMNFGGDVGDPYPFAISPPTIPEGLSAMNPGPGPASTTAGRALNKGNVSLMNSKYWAESAAEDFLYDTQAFMGLKGFLAGTVTERLFNTNKVVPTLETAGRISSFSRSFYDANLGGMGFLTEPVRRALDKPEYRQYGLNPIPNQMPEWLGAKFLTGDPYVKLLRGELRLPGDAYIATHTNVNRTMPARASMLGGTIENIVQYFTGLIPPNADEQYDILEQGTAMHRSIQEELATEGMLIQAEAFVQDVKNDITGHVDAIIRDGEGGGGRRALEIKTINAKGFAKLNAPKKEHFSQLNFYLHQLKLREGTFLYINRENPSQVKTFEITYSKSKWIKDIQKLQKARHVAKVMMEEGLGDTLGYSYSWADRMKILADVAPNSKEFKEAKQIVERQIKFNVLDKDEVEKYETSLKMKQARIRSYELYPNRFKGKVLHPEEVANIQSINEDIKAAAKYTLPERAVGALWENFSNSNNFLSNKLFNSKDPLEHYKMTRLYGKEYKPWDEPIRGWVDPYLRSLASKTNTAEGAVGFGSLGYVFGGGPIGAVIGSAIGSLYGTGHGIYRAMTGTTYIPRSIEEKRQIVSYFDAAKYERNDMLASLSTGLTQQEFLAQKNATLKAFNEGGPGATVANLFRATSPFEKPYIEAWLNTTDQDEREQIIKYAPNDLAEALKRQWNTNDSKDATSNYVQLSSSELTKGAPKYQFDRSIMDPRVPLEDIELKTVQQHGLDQFEFGLGWNQQMLRMQENNLNIQAANIERFNGSPEPLGDNMSPANVKGIINNYFSKSGIRSSSQVYIDQTINYNQINVTIRRDRANTVINALNNRQKYGLST